MVTDLWCHLTYNLRGAWHTLYAMLLLNYNEMLPEIHTTEKCCIFLKLFFTKFQYIPKTGVHIYMQTA